MNRDGEKKPLPAEAAAALRGFKTYLSAECGLAVNSVRAYLGDLEGFLARNPDYNAASLADVVAYVRELSARGEKATSLNRRLSSLRVFYRYLVGEGEVKTSPLELMESPRLPNRLPDFLESGDVDRIIAAASAAATASEKEGWPPLKRAAAGRDLALLALAYSCGLRASELVGLKRDDVDLNLAILRVRGKGGKERLVPFGEVARDAVQRYLEAASFSTQPSPFLFPSRRGGAVSRQLLWTVVKKYAGRAGVAGVKPHLFRHTFATHLVQAGADIRTVQELLGHANINTTQIYAHLDLKRMEAFHQKYHPRK